MSSSISAKKSSRNWAALTQQEQLDVLRRLCGSKEAVLKKRYSDILAIGVGYKTKDGKPLTEVCLGFLVKTKTSNKPCLVPSFLNFYVYISGKRTLLCIPTDIEEVGDGVPHGVINVASGVRAVSTQNNLYWVNGSACCVVVQSDEPNNRYVLGCHHVLALSLLTQGGNIADAFLLSQGQKIGRLSKYLPMSGTGAPCLDAALSILEPNMPVIWEGPFIAPSGVGNGINPPANCKLYTPRGPLATQYVKEFANIPLYYPKIGTVIIRAAYQYYADAEEGDSGSPLMEPDGTLQGMHFWGDSARRIAFAIPAFILFQPGLFSINFNLP